MATLSLRMPNSLHKHLKKLAKQEGISINQLINSAVAEKMSSLMTLDYLQQRASKGSRAQLRAILDEVPDVEPEEYDRLPARR
jgi:predicted DNA-binding ribbon-helix-helix protein